MSINALKSQENMEKWYKDIKHSSSLSHPPLIPALPSCCSSSVQTPSLHSELLKSGPIPLTFSQRGSTNRTSTLIFTGSRMHISLDWKLHGDLPRDRNKAECLRRSLLGKSHFPVVFSCSSWKTYFRHIFLWSSPDNKGEITLRLPWD